MTTKYLVAARAAGRIGYNHSESPATVAGATLSWKSRLGPKEILL